MSPRDKARLLGLFFWLFTIFNIVLIAALGVIYTAIVGVAVSATPHRASDPPPGLIVGIVAGVFIFITAFTVLFSIPKIVAGFGLRKERSWARTWSIVAAIMCCLSFPFGTAIGVFGLVFLFSDDGKRYFAEQQFGQIGGMAPPPANSWQ